MNMFHNETRRTRGDGMEHDCSNTDQKSADLFSKLRLYHEKQINLKPEPTTLAPIPGKNLIYRAPETCYIPPPAVVPKGKIYHLVPRLIVSNKKSSLKTKEPRFVPFEPYKAAVNPIIAQKRISKTKLSKKNNLDLNTLVLHMSDIKSSEMAMLQPNRKELTEIDKERISYETKIQDIEKDRDFISAQLKSQVQVNTELKNLLVAAVGEDLQTRVNVLTEDKLHLARALLSSAQNLSSHTEQIEYLASQSEVWRSKFLASSLMVEELARWKASLTHKNQLLLRSNKQMLETVSTLREMDIEVLKNLKFLAKLKTLNLQSSNVLDLTAECLNISQQLILHSGIGMPSSLDVAGLASVTDAEKLAIEALQNSNEPLMSTDEAFKAIVCQAFPATKNILRNDDNDNNLTAVKNS